MGDAEGWGGAGNCWRLAGTLVPLVPPQPRSLATPPRQAQEECSAIRFKPPNPRARGCPGPPLGRKASTCPGTKGADGGRGASGELGVPCSGRWWEGNAGGPALRPARPLFGKGAPVRFLPLSGTSRPASSLAPASPAAWLGALETGRLPNKGRLPITFARLFKRASPEHKAAAGNGNFMNPNQSKGLLTQCEARLKSLIINRAKRKNKMYLWYTENSGY